MSIIVLYNVYFVCLFVSFSLKSFDIKNLGKPKPQERSVLLCSDDTFVFDYSTKTLEDIASIVNMAENSQDKESSSSNIDTEDSNSYESSDESSDKESTESSLKQYSPDYIAKMYKLFKAQRERRPSGSETDDSDESIDNDEAEETVCNPWIVRFGRVILIVSAIGLIFWQRTILKQDWFRETGLTNYCQVK